MATTVKIPSAPKRLKTAAVGLRKELKDIGQEIKQELEQIVAPFQSNVSIVVIDRKDSRDYIVEIMGNPNDSATTNAAGSAVSSHDLIKFLDGGTSIQYVGVPEGFSNETTPNSKDTSSKDYDRDDIYFYRRPYPDGIEARNWFKLLIDDYGPQIKQRFNRTIGSYLR